MLEDPNQVTKHFMMLKEEVAGKGNLVDNIEMRIYTPNGTKNHSEDYFISTVILYKNIGEKEILQYDSNNEQWEKDDIITDVPPQLAHDESLWKTSLFDLSKINPETLVKVVKLALSDPRRANKPESFVSLVTVSKDAITVMVEVPGYAIGHFSGGFSIATDLDGNLL